MFRYKTKDGQELSLPRFGTTKDGIIESETPIENPNLELITGDSPPQNPGYIAGVVPQSAQAAPVQPQPSAPIESAPLNTQSESEI